MTAPVYCLGRMLSPFEQLYGLLDVKIVRCKECYNYNTIDLYFNAIRIVRIYILARDIRYDHSITTLTRNERDKF